VTQTPFSPVPFAIASFPTFSSTNVDPRRLEIAVHVARWEFHRDPMLISHYDLEDRPVLLVFQRHRWLIFVLGGFSHPASPLLLPDGSISSVYGFAL